MSDSELSENLKKPDPKYSYPHGWRKTMLPSLKVALIYAAVGSLWIVFTDKLVALFAGDDFVRLTRLQTYKGWFFIFLTTLLLYFLVSRYMKSVQAGEESYRIVAETSTDAIITIDEQSRILFANKATERIFGYNVNELLGKMLTSLMPERLRQRHLNGIKRYLETGQRHVKWQGFEQTGLHKSGREIPLEISYNVYVTDGSHFFTGFIRDITEHKIAEEERNRNLHYFESIDKINKVISKATDLDRMMSDVLDLVLSTLKSDRAWLFYPCDPDAPSWRVPMERTRPEYPGAFALNADIPMEPDVASALKIALATEGPVVYDPKTGRSVPEEIKKQFSVQSQIIKVIYPKVGKPWVFGLHQCSYPRIWSKEDIKLFSEIGYRITDSLSSQLSFQNLSKSESKYKKLAEELEESEEKYHKLIETANDAIIVADAETGKIIQVNEAAEKLLGKPRDKIIGMDQTVLHPKEEAQRYKKIFMDYVQTGKGIAGDIYVVREDGTNVPIEISASVTEIKGRKTIQGIFRDITERKKTQEALRKKDHAIRKAYVDVFSAVTGGRLIIMTPDEIQKALGEPVTGVIEIKSDKDLAGGRQFIEKALEALILNPEKISDVIMAANEAMTNAIKHAGGGQIQIFKKRSAVQILVSDQGPGIDFSVLPKATLVSGFSTKQSLGMGFSFMLEFYDRVLLSTQPGNTSIVLEINL